MLAIRCWVQTGAPGSPAGFLTSTSVWGTFTIFRKSSDSDHSLTYQQSSSANFIHYNMDVYLKCRLSNLMSSTYVIRKVEKNVIIKRATNLFRKKFEA